MNFFDQVGTMALGSRLRMLSERITEDAAQIYRMYDVALKPKWFPVFYILSQYQQKSITAIAEEIGHSHPSVSKIVREMSKHGIVAEKKDKNDGRKTIVTLTVKGNEIRSKIEDQYIDVENAIQEILGQTRHNIWTAIEEWEFMLNQRSLLSRVQGQKKTRTSKNVNIVAYSSKYHQHFKQLNEAWITTHFKMEEADRIALNDPEAHIINKGGHIVVALYQDEPVGVCALIKMDDPEYDYELAKMAVAPKAKGKGIGWLLGKAVIDKAKSLGAEKIYLESNTLLKPAINLYQKLGFQKVAGHQTPYERCNIQMELKLM